MQRATSFSLSAGRSLGRSVAAAVAEHEGRLALVAGRERWSYRDLACRASGIAAHVADACTETSPPLAAVLASRAASDYAGVLGVLYAGAGYVPLNAKFPAARNARMLALSRAPCIVASETSEPSLRALLPHVARPLRVLLPDTADVGAFAQEFPAHRFVGRGELIAATPREPLPVDEASIAYVMFTSGTTGDPKGVMVTHANVLHHLGAMWRRYAIGAQDRLSQTFDLTFDLSVFDMFVAWGKGASVHVLSAKEQMAPSKFIRAEELTVWFSVPSVGMMLRGLRMLNPGAFPSLRVSLFCGERLPASVAEAWQAAAPASIVENLYGPTEATIACTHYRWESAKSPEECVEGVVPIGDPYEGMAAAVVAPDLALVARGERGELCVRGPQVAAGYLGDVEKTSARFVAMPWDDGPQNRWYRTGDAAFFDRRGVLVHAGRLDEQIKLRGFRVELGEVEHALRVASGVDLVAVVPWPVGEAGPTGLVGFVAGHALDVASVTERMRAQVPEYMVPGKFVAMERLPLNANGKIDKLALQQGIKEEDGTVQRS